MYKLFRYLALVLLLGTSSIVIKASETDGLFWYTLSGDEATVIGTRSELGDRAYIPSQVTFNNLKYNVVRISDNAFSGWQLLEECSIPEGVEDIGCNIFSGTKVSTIVVPSTVKYAGSPAGSTTVSRGSAFANSTMRTIIYLPLAPPRYWNAVSNTYVVDPSAYTKPNTSSSNAKIKGLVEFSATEFEYTGQPQTVAITNNLSSEGWDAKFTIPELETNAGSYEIFITIKFQHKTTYQRFTAQIPYRYTIKKRKLNVVINNMTREYGDENPRLTYSISGFVSGETETNLNIKPSVQCQADRFSNVGQYLISGGESSSLNYDFNYTNGILNVIKSPLSITVKGSEKVYGQPNPDFILTYDGLKNNEKSPKWDNAPVFTTSADNTSNVGKYDVFVNCVPHNYEIVANNKGILTISKAPLSLQVNSASRIYMEENPEFGFTLSGLLNGDTNACLSKLPVYSCSAATISDCGDYAITASGADAMNYTITYIDGKLTINPANLILIASEASREYGDPNPILRYDAIGLKGNDQLATSLVEEPLLTTTAVESSNSGQYSITISGGKSKNYSLSYKNGILTVTKAPLSVIANNAEKVYGENNPVFKRSYLGFKLSDTETTSFSQLPKISCEATQGSDVGTFPIIVSGGLSKNYEILEYTPGVLTIKKAPLILTANDKTRLYYEENPQFDFTLSGLKNNDTKSCVTSAPTYNCGAVLTSNVGSYAIIPSGAESKNYTFEYQNGSLTINPRPLTASVGNYTRKYNTDNPTFEITYTGFVANENSSILTQQATVSCEANKTSDVGVYSLTPTGGYATNYTISKYNNGSLTIEKADQSITWNQDLFGIELYSQIALTATSDAGLAITYEMSPNNVATLYDNAGVWYLDCYGSGAVSIRAVQKGDKNHNAASTVSKTLVVSGSGDDPTSPQIYLHVETAGTLPTLIAENRKNHIKNLRLTGYLNGTDINYIREMAGSDSYGNTTTGILETLDISGCTIVSGGRSYYRSYQTSNLQVGDYMFYNCGVLVNLLLPTNATILEDYALANCARLSTLSLPNGITSIGREAFRNDIGLLRIPMPEQLVSIGDKAFIGCNNLTEIDIPANVRFIGDGIVKDCENISRINVDATNQYFSSKDGVLFDYDCTTLKIFPMNNPSLTYKVMNGVTRIAPYSFVNAKKLTEVTLPSSLLTIGTDAFIGCVNLNVLHTEAIVPPVCDNDCFESVSKTRCELQVPQGCYSAYWVAPVWSEFNKIVENGSGSIIDVSMDNIEVSVDGLNIMVTGIPNGIYVCIYQMNGLLIYQQRSKGEDISYQPATPGTYIVAVGDKTFKILIK